MSKLDRLARALGVSREDLLAEDGDDALAALDARIDARIAAQGAPPAADGGQAAQTPAAAGDPSVHPATAPAAPAQDPVTQLLTAPAGPAAPSLTDILNTPAAPPPPPAGAPASSPGSAPSHEGGATPAEAAAPAAAAAPNYARLAGQLAHLLRVYAPHVKVADEIAHVHGVDVNGLPEPTGIIYRQGQSVAPAAPPAQLPGGVQPPGPAGAPAAPEAAPEFRDDMSPAEFDKWMSAKMADEPTPQAPYEIWDPRKSTTAPTVEGPAPVVAAGADDTTPPPTPAAPAAPTT